ncbi:hypothetical protein ACNPM8_10615, partial [Glutamicibacter sp. AGC46]
DATDAVDADATDADAVDADATDAVDADATDADAVDADATDADGTDVDGDEDGEYLPVDIVTPLEGSTVEGPNVLVKGTSDPNAVVTVKATEVADSAIAKVFAFFQNAIAAPELVVTADDEGNWEVIFEEVEVGQYSVFADDGRTNDTTTFQVVEAAVDADATDADATDADATDADATDADATDADATDADATDAGDNDSNDSGKNDSKNDSKKDKLADTGANAPLVIGGIALLLVLAGGAVTVLRRMKA